MSKEMNKVEKNLNDLQLNIDEFDFLEEKDLEAVAGGLKVGSLYIEITS
jgi:hypothetical protein